MVAAATGLGLLLRHQDISCLSYVLTVAWCRRLATDDAVAVDGHGTADTVYLALFCLLLCRTLFGSQRQLASEGHVLGR